MEFMKGFPSALYNFKAYWWGRARLETIFQKAHLRRLRLKDSIADRSLSVRILVQIGWAIIPTLIVAASLVALCELGEAFLREHLHNLFNGVGSAPAKEFILSFVGLVAQIAGIFLGLYYAALGVVVSTAYAKLPNQLRWLLLKERIGNLYIFLTTVLAAMALITLSLWGFGYQTGYLNLLVICLLSVSSVLSFVRFGQHVFNLFDITSVLEEPYRIILRSVDRVSSVKLRDYSSIQELSRYRVKQALQAFNDVIVVSTNLEFDRDRLMTRLLRYLLATLANYVGNKGKIATASKWFPSIYHHRNWLTSDSIYITTSLSTGAPLFPTEVQDVNWFEDEILRLSNAALKSLLDGKDEAAYKHAYSAIMAAVASLTARHTVIEANQLVQNTTNTVRSFLNELATANSLDVHQLKPSALNQLLSLHCYTYAQLVVGMGHAATGLTLQRLEDLAAMLIATPGHLDRKVNILPRRILDEFYRLSDLIKFERSVERTVITSKWYIVQIFELALVRHLNEIVEQTYERVAAFFEPESFLSDTFPSTPAIPSHLECYRAMIGIEVMEKLLFQLNRLRVVYRDIQGRRRADDIPFPAIDFDDFKNRVAALKRTLVLRLITHATTIGYKERQPSIPDFFGQAYFFAVEEARQCLARDDEQLFTTFFARAFSLAFMSYENVSRELKGHPDNTRVIFMTESLEDIICLSGLAFIYAELVNMSFSETVIKIWDKYLNSVEDRASVIRFLLITIDYRKNEFSLKPRSVIRGMWEQELALDFRKRGLLKGDWMGMYSSSSKDEKVHQSALIRTLSRSFLMMGNLLEVFVSLYLLKQPETNGIEIPASVESFQRSLQKAENDE